ncbi:anti-sigma-F factor Fin family protein [Aciduricibacillus chroicocephali]|uniref:Anti-sigma-F factor Fin family protein n=1 Tax=Aciduricibacillus chroicocephali TaxID=3054939 RepID=A0ABY9KV49_9BACI|nr:anti-sigma-F factor Fin family protein [Bacillaceae bacterium 44XB]
MAIIYYKCRHCQQEIGKLEKREVDASMLGLHVLSDSEKSEMIEHAESGEMHIRSICDQCESTLKKYPQYYELDYFIH